MSIPLLTMSSIFAAIRSCNIGTFFQPINLDSICPWKVTIGNLPCLLSDHFSGYLCYPVLFHFFPGFNSFSHSAPIVTFFCTTNVALKSPTFYCVRLFAAFSFSTQLLVHSFLILLKQSVNSILESSRAEVFLGKSVLKICSKFTGQQPCGSAIS